MKRLILMRHAKTEPFGEGIDDFGRALTDQGHSDAKRIAEEIVTLGWSPERILVSTARRARETCSEVARVFEGEKVRPMESLYLCGARGLVERSRVHHQAVFDLAAVCGRRWPSSVLRHTV